MIVNAKTNADGSIGIRVGKNTFRVATHPEARAFLAGVKVAHTRLATQIAELMDDRAVGELPSEPEPFDDTLSSLPVSGEVEGALRPMAEFPEDATWNLVLVEKGFNVEWRLVHWACGDGDGLMPAFRGLFVSDGYGFREFEPNGWTVLGWLPMVQPRQARVAPHPHDADPQGGGQTLNETAASCKAQPTEGV